MNCPAGPHPYSKEKLTQTQIWYNLLTEEKFFAKCKRFNAFVVKVISRSADEGIVEVDVKSIKDISTSKRPQHNLT